MRARSWLLFLLSAPSLLAQSSGTITGRVLDQSQAAVPQASITVRAVETGVVFRTTTNAEGYYTIPSLLPVEYVVTAELAGFKKSGSAPVKLDTTAVVRVDLVLTPGDVKQSIEVTAAAPTALETQTGMVGGTVTQKEMDSLPLQGRDTLELALTVPGVGGELGSDGDTYGGAFSFSGGRPGTSSILADGSNSSSVAIGRATITFSPDTIQEFKVITSSFSAQFGASGGGFISMVSKSGTDEIRGNAFWYHRNPALAARTFNSPLPPQLRRHNFGATLGGPVVLPKLYNGRHKTFFFFSVEPTRSASGVAQYDRVPTASERQGDFSQMWMPPGQSPPLLYRRFDCFPSEADCQKLTPVHVDTATSVYPLFDANDPDPARRGHVIPKAYLDAMSQKILQDVPLPNIPFTSDGYNYLGVRGSESADNRWNIKIDQILSAKNRFSGRFSRIPARIDAFQLSKTNFFLGADPARNNHVRQFFLSDSYTLSPHIVNEFRGTYIFGDFSKTLPGDLGTVNYTREKYGLPNVMPFGSPTLDMGFPSRFGPQGKIGLYKEHQYQFSDDVTMIFGRHSIVTGVDIRFLQSNVYLTGLQEAANGTYTFAAAQTQSGNANIPTGLGGLQFASFLLGVPNSVSLSGQIIPYYYRWKASAAYVQDDFKINPRLTLNLGLRYQYNSPRWEKYNRQASVDLDHPVDLISADGRKTGVTFNYAYTGFSGSRYLEQNHTLNFEPRFGFAWAPVAKLPGMRHFVVRGGYGISHATNNQAGGREPRPDFGTGTGTSGYVYAAWVGNAAPRQYSAQDPNSVIGLGRNPPVIVTNPIVSAIPQDGKLCIGCTPVDIRVPSGNLIVYNHHNRSPYIQTWSLTTQFELPQAMVLSISYLGQKGTHLPSSQLMINTPDKTAFQNLLDSGGDPNGTVPDPFGRVDSRGLPLTVTLADLMRPYPTAGNIVLLGQTDSNSIYHGGTFSLERRYRSGYGVRFNYTWSKSIDNSSDANSDLVNYYSWGRSLPQNPEDIKNERSVSLYDSRHRLNLTFNADLPLGKGRPLLPQAGKLVQALLGGWSVNGVGGLYSGRPLWVGLINGIGTAATDTNGIPGANSRWTNIRPDIIPGVPLLSPLWNRSVANDVPYFNPQVFARPKFGHYGNAPRTIDYMRMPWTPSLNTSLFKEFHPFKESRRYLQLRMEAFNVLNHANFRTNIENNMFTKAVPLSRTMDLSGPLPYFAGLSGNPYPVGSRDYLLADAYNRNFLKFDRRLNSDARIIQLAVKFYW